MKTDTNSQIAEAIAQGRRDFRERCATILKSPAARGRCLQALALALDTDMTAEAAIAALADRPIDPADPINPVSTSKSEAGGGVFGGNATTSDIADAAWARTLGRLQ